MRPSHQMHITSIRPINRQAIVHFQDCIGVWLEPTRLHALFTQLLGLDLVLGHYQQVAVCLAEHVPFVAAKVDEK